MFIQRGKVGKNSGLFDNKNKGRKGDMGGRLYSGKGGKVVKVKVVNEGGYNYYNPSEACIKPKNGCAKFSSSL